MMVENSKSQKTNKKKSQKQNSKSKSLPSRLVEAHRHGGGLLEICPWQISRHLYQVRKRHIPPLTTDRVFDRCQG
jgi:hypothetical protein